MRRILSAIALSLAIALPAALPAAAQGLKAPVIAVVDVQEVLRKAKAGQALRDEVENQRSAFERDLEGRRTVLRDEEEKLRRQQSVLSPEALEQRRRDLERKFNDARRETEERQNLLNRVFNQAMGTLRGEMAKSVATVMQQRNANVVLPRATVLVFDEDMNITESVIAELDKRLPRVALDFKNPPPKRQ